jgi:hypothetical protein
LRSLLAYPLGKFMAWMMPIVDISLPSQLPWIGGFTFSLNPGESAAEILSSRKSFHL